jgi:hypothetical protein
MDKPVITLRADDFTDFADFVALGSNATDRFAIEFQKSDQKKIIKEAWEKTKALGIKYDAESEKISTSIKLDRDDEKRVDILDEKMKRTKIYKDFWEADARLTIECEIFAYIDYYGARIQNEPSEAEHNRFYYDMVMRIGGEAIAVPELASGNLSRRKSLGRDRSDALRRGYKFSCELMDLLEIAIGDDFQRKKYYNTEILENDFIFGRPFTFCLQVSTKNDADKLLNVIIGTLELSDRKKVECFRSAVGETRATSDYIYNCDKMCLFSQGELETVLQSISRHNSKIRTLANR